MFLKRDLAKTLERFSHFPVVAIMGPRQSGKTTLTKNFFKKHAYLSFEDPLIREFAASDPQGFLREHENKHGIILDEFQYVPQILSYLQLEVDTKKRPGYFVITGSQNFLMNQAVTQSLAGRVGILTLLPFSLHELKKHAFLPERAVEYIVRGAYPRVYTENITPADAYASYIHTYIERDVRQLINVGDLHTFQKFLSLCAGHAGQLLNISNLAMNCGISAPTATRWLSVLEASYIIFLLQPHFKNFNKRIVKTPKLFFFDTGIACSLLGIATSKTVATSPYRGPLFENLIISDFAKQFYNKGQRPPLSFWRDNNGRIEVDCIVEYAQTLTSIEIKASETASLGFFDSLQKWNEMAQIPPDNNYVIYTGDTTSKRQKGHFISWQSAGTLIKKITHEDGE